MIPQPSGINLVLSLSINIFCEYPLHYKNSEISYIFERHFNGKKK